MEYPKDFTWHGYHPSCSMKPVMASLFPVKDGRQYRDFVPDWSPVDIVIV